ncbi:TIM barrel protein [Candidatus Woesearchaeota archaeon]|nr:TIM barrel protein [Candidatus Woesearchaeota archaeon]
MTRVISFALGTLWRWGKSQNRNDLIKYVKELKIDGVEITFSSKEQLYKFKLSKENEKWLKNLDYVTIHAPFKLVGKKYNKKEIIEQLKIIAKLYKQVNAKNVIIHPKDLPPPDILNKFNFKVSTENLVKKKKVTIADLRKIFRRYPKIGLCLDVSHAYLWSKHETLKLIKAFEEKITQVHLSGTYRKKDHQSLRVVSKDFIFSIKPIFKLKVPIVIEEDMKIKSKKFVYDEVNFIKNMFEK